MKRLSIVLVFLVLPCFGSVSFTNLTSGGSTAATTSYTTASVTPTAHAPVLIATSAHLGSSNGPGHVSSMTGDGLTLALVLGIDSGLTTGTAKSNRLEVWCGFATSPTAGAITITWPTSPTATSWTIDQSSGAAATCSGAIGITASATADTATASPLTVSMGSFDFSSSATYGAGYTDATETINSGASFTQLGSNDSNSNSIASEYAASNVSPVTFTYTTSTVRWGIIGVEIKIPSGSTFPHVE